MQQFYIGDSKQYLTAQYARSGRSTCRQCKQKIPKQELRIGLCFDDDQYAATYWYHMKCFHFRQHHRVIQVQKIDQTIYGIQDLDAADSDRVVTFLKDQFRCFKENRSARKRNNKETNNEKLEKQEKQEENKTQYANDKISQKVLHGVQPKGKKNKKLKSNKSDPKSRLLTEPESKLPTQRPFAQASQIKKYDQYVKEYSKLSTLQLRQILGRNNQARTGTKEQLVQKCADGKLFGRIPICGKCGAGRLRFNRKNEKYTCPGYMQDTQFVNCNATFAFDEVTRKSWAE